jgi:hypothetical protein
MIVAFSQAAVSQFDITVPQEGAVSSLTRQAVTVKGFPGFAVELLVDGNVVMKNKIRPDGIADFLNIEVQPGDVTFEARMVNPNGSVIASKQRMIHILGPPSTIALGTDASLLIADGKSTTKGTVQLFDEWGYPIQDGYMATVMADSGMIVAEDVDPTKRGIQIRVVNGVAAFDYKAGISAGTAVISASVGTIETSKEIELNTAYEKFTLVGLATGTGMAASAQRLAGTTDFTRSYPDGFEKDGRLAVYARGTVMKDYLLTFSFDSDRRNMSRLFRDLDPDFLYSIYGDNSMLTYDVQSSRNLFFKLERNQSYLLFGDYNTDFTKQEFSLYSRSLNGLKAHYQDKRWNVTGFGSFTDHRPVQKEFRGEGLSGFYNLGYSRITPGSEKVRIETRDRFHSEVLLKQVDMYRFSDYEVDYVQGTLFFKQPVPGIDANGNPVYIVVTFEAVTDQSKTYIAGGRAENALTENLSVGVTGVIEEQDPTNYSLLGGDIKFKNDYITLGGEVARSSNVLASGLAYKIESSVSPTPNLSMKGYYRKVGNDFFNITQSGSQRELGSKKYGTDGSYNLFSQTKLLGGFYRQEQESRSGLVNLRSVSGGVEHQISTQFTGQVNVENLTYDGPSPDTTTGSLSTRSTLGTAKLNYSPTNDLTLSLQHERNLGTNQDITGPNATSLQASYKVTEDVTLQGQQKFYEDGGNLSTVGLITTPFDGTKVYGRYEIGNAIGEHRNRVSIGLNNTLKLPYDLTANLAFEKAKSLERRLGEASTQDHTSISGSLEYLPQENSVKLSTKAEYGENNLSIITNYTFGGDVRLFDDLSLIAKYRFSKERAVANDNNQTRNHLITGFAYRPLDFNWLNAIGKFEVKQDNNHYLNPFIDYGAFITSIHIYTEPIRRVEIGGKYAYKVSNESSVGFSAAAHTHFYLVHVGYDIAERFDVGAEYRLLWQSEVRDLLNGYSAELGYIAVNNLRVGVGYNFKGYKERDLVDYSLWSKGPFVRVSFKFNEEFLGW